MFSYLDEEKEADESIAEVSTPKSKKKRKLDADTSALSTSEIATPKSQKKKKKKDKKED